MTGNVDHFGAFDIIQSSIDWILSDILRLNRCVAVSDDLSNTSSKNISDLFIKHLKSKKLIALVCGIVHIKPCHHVKVAIIDRVKGRQAPLY